jgi:hypothetical protein
MAERIARETVAQRAIIHDSPPERQPTQVDRSFELPTALFGATAALYLGFVAMMGIAFANPELSILVAIFALVIVAGFGIPTIWVKMKPESSQHAASWSRFKAEGVMILTGRCSASAAAAQVLILPVLIFVWGVAAVTIAALVR